MAANASELFEEMLTAVDRNWYLREVNDPQSPAQGPVREAQVGCSFVLRNPLFNVVGQRSIDLRWAVANVLQFFSGSEHAAPLRKYNKRADKFLTGDRWVGAYGFAAMPGVRACVELLRKEPSSRRAVVAMPGYCAATADFNQPACWNLLHFILGRYGLDLLVYQRSLNLFGVMPYDLVLLTNLLLFASKAAGIDVNALRWTVGSLHHQEGPAGDGGNRARNVSLVVPYEVLSVPGSCAYWLQSPAPSETCLQYLSMEECRS